MKVDPRLLALYLVGVAVVSMVLPQMAIVGAIAALQIVLGWWAGVGPRRQLRAIRRLAVFFAFLTFFWVMFPGKGIEGTQTLTIPGVGWELTVYPGGLRQAALMVLRILSVVYASMLVRSASDPRALAQGLRGLGVPRLAAISLDASLSLLEGRGGRRGGDGSGRGGGRGRRRDDGGARGGEGEGDGDRRNGEDDGEPEAHARGGGGGGGGGGGRGGGGGGGGGGRGRHRDAAAADEAPSEPPTRRARLRAYISAIRRADASMLAGPMQRTLDEARAELARTHPDLPPDRAADAAVIVAVSTVMLSLKAFKTLPGVPFAPGHRNAVMLPLYVVSAELTTSRLGATTCGFVMGTASVLTGDGRYGIFEVFKHIVPGVMVDVLYPLIRRLGAARLWLQVAFGTLLAAGRFATELVVALLLAVPTSFYAYLGTTALTHLIAGALSGFITTAVLRSIDQIRQELR